MATQLRQKAKTALLKWIFLIRFLQLTSLVGRISHGSAAPLTNTALYDLYFSICKLCMQLRNYPSLGPEKLEYVQKIFQRSVQNAEMLNRKLDSTPQGPALGASQASHHSSLAHAAPAKYSANPSAPAPAAAIPAHRPTYGSTTVPAGAPPAAQPRGGPGSTGLASCCAYCSRPFEETSYLLFANRIPALSCNACKRQFCEACLVKSGHAGVPQVCVMCAAAEKEAIRQHQLQLQQRLKAEAEERHRQQAAQQALHEQYIRAQAELAQQRRMVEEQQVALEAMRLDRDAAARDEQRRAQAASQLVALGFSELEARVALGENGGNVQAAVAALHQRMQAQDGTPASIPCRDLSMFEFRSQPSLGEYIAVDKASHEIVTMLHFQFEENDHVEANVRARIRAVNAIAAELGPHLPAMLPILGTVYVDRGCYLVVPTVPHSVRLREWLGQPREPALVKSVFRQLLQAILHLHARRALFVLVSLDDVIVANGPDSPDSHVFLTHTAAAGRVDSATAPPEWSESAAWLPSSDIYVFGSLLFTALVGQTPVLLPGRDSVLAPVSCPDSARQVLDAALTRDPAARPSAAALLLQSYFVGDDVTRLRAEGTIPSTDRKLAALREYIQSVEDKHGRLHLNVRRTHMIESTCHALVSCSPVDLRKKLSTHFEGESGVDSGGLTKELYSTFFSTLFALDGPERLFDCASGAVGAKPCYLPMPLEDEKDVHVRDSRLMLYEGVGRLIGKALFDNFTISLPLCPAAFKFLLDIPPSFADLEAYDPALAAGYRSLLSVEDASTVGLAFDDLGEPGRLVDNSNRREYVNKCVENHLVAVRREPLVALRRGFAALPSYLHVKLLTWAELATLLQGDVTVSAADLLVVTQFQSFPVASQAPHFFRQYASSLDDTNLRRLLCYVTASAVVPPATAPLVVRMRAGDASRDFPAAHTCFNTLDLPDYATAALLAQRMQYCLDHLEDSGFGIA